MSVSTQPYSYFSTSQALTMWADNNIYATLIYLWCTVTTAPGKEHFRLQQLSHVGSIFDCNNQVI